MVDNSLAIEVFRTRQDVRMFGITPRSLQNNYASHYWNSRKALWRGKLAVFNIMDPDDETETTLCEVRLLDNTTDEVFAIAPYACVGGDASIGEGASITPDSSKSYTLTVVNGHNSVTIGISFLNSQDANDFSEALRDYRRHAAQHVAAPVIATNHSLAAGKSIHVNIKKKSDEDDDHNSTQFDTKAGPSGISSLLPPPPSSSTVDDDDEFGDFVS